MVGLGSNSESTDLMWADACSSVKIEQTTFAVNELCQRMSDLSQHSFSQLKRLVRYLEVERDNGSNFSSSWT